MTKENATKINNLFENTTILVGKNSIEIYNLRKEFLTKCQKKKLSQLLFENDAISKYKKDILERMEKKISKEMKIKIKEMEKRSGDERESNQINCEYTKQIKTEIKEYTKDDDLNFNKDQDKRYKLDKPLDSTIIQLFTPQEIEENKKKARWL